MADKTKEKECLSRVIRCCNIKGEFARKTRGLLLLGKNNIDSDNERPDFVIKYDDLLLGIEHCQADVIFKKKNKVAHSMVDRHTGDMNKLIKRYKDNDSLDDDILSGKALEPIFDVLKENIEYRDAFKYSDFIENFRRVCSEHNDKYLEYRRNLKVIDSEKRIMLGCLVDIPYPNEKEYSVSDEKGIRKLSINGIPMTIDMVNIISSMRGFDFVILCMHCFDNPKRKTVCYYFIPRNIRAGIKEQRISPIISFELLSPFGIKEKVNIDFSLNSDKTTSDTIVYNATISKKGSRDSIKNRKQ